MDLHTLKELEVDDLKHFGIPIGPARRIFNVLRRHREDDLSVVVRTMKTQVNTTAAKLCFRWFPLRILQSETLHLSWSQRFFPAYVVPRVKSTNYPSLASLLTFVFRVLSGLLHRSE